MVRTEPPFGAHAGKKMMETLFLSNWQHEKNGERLSDPAKMKGYQGGDEVRVKRGEMEDKRLQSSRGRGGKTPYYKRRRIRGGGVLPMGKRGNDDDMCVVPLLEGARLTKIDHTRKQCLELSLHLGAAKWLERICRCSGH
jgi:hypothetical protein